MAANDMVPKMDYQSVEIHIYDPDGRRENLEVEMRAPGLNWFPRRKMPLELQRLSAAANPNDLGQVWGKALFAPGTLGYRTNDIVTGVALP